jgi:hypothetical protein
MPRYRSDRAFIKKQPSFGFLDRDYGNPGCLEFAVAGSRFDFSVPGLRIPAIGIPMNKEKIRCRLKLQSSL